MSLNNADQIRAIFSNASANVANDAVGLFRQCLHYPESAQDVADVIVETVKAAPDKWSMGVAILAVISESLIMINKSKEGPLYDAHKTLQRAALTLQHHGV